MVVFQASNAFLFLLLIQMERFCKQKQYSEGMCEFASRHFRLQIFVLLCAVGKSVIEDHKYRFIRNAEKPSLSVLFHFVFPAKQVITKHTQHLTAVMQVITRNKKYLFFLHVFCLGLYPGFCFHLKLFFTAVITKRADNVKPK